MSVPPLVRSSAFPPTVTFPLPGPRLTLPLVEVMDAEPAKFGDNVGPLPDSLAEEVVMVYVPTGRRCPLSVSASAGTVRAIETLPVTFAV